MMKNILLILGTLGILCSSQAQELTPEQEEIKDHITEYYWNVMYTNAERKPINAIAEGFSEDFHMYVYWDGELSKRTRDEWMAILQKNRDKADPNMPKKSNSLEFGYIDVTGYTASTKLLISQEGKLKYTDYMTLYKVDGKWQVMSKLFTYHGE
ncbi:MAG: nuclear transport factor 2 family protein [Cyclobacteriaceae bacterium]